MNEYYPDKVTHPGETLREMLADYEMTVGDLAQYSGIDFDTINAIAEARAPITPEIATKLNLVFLGIPVQFWINRQSRYDEAISRMWTPVLDLGWVELQDMMGDDLAIVSAARTSYLGESKGDAQDRKLLDYLMQHNHGTPFEMVVFRFRVRAPEIVFRQWVRHRIGSFNVQSRRYTEVEDDEFYLPSEWRTQDYVNRQGSAGILDDEAGAVLSDKLERIYTVGMAAYRRALDLGVAREQARLFLPGFAVYSTFVWCVNARSLMNFLKLRMDVHAQLEIQQYAKAVWQIFEAKLPWTAAAFKEKEKIE
jgi:thymidylate synthase (FAD)